MHGELRRARSKTRSRALGAERAHGLGVSRPIALLLLALLFVPLLAQDIQARSSGAPQVDPSLDAHADHVARFMAGLPQLDPSSPYKALENQRAWRAHKEAMDKHWSGFEAERLSAMRAWQRDTLGPMSADHLPLFYPFSGPDFITAHVLYPDAPRYVLVALESVRYPPDFFAMTPPYLWKSLRQMVHALRDLYQVGYFITSHMQRDLVQRAAEGAVPSLYILLARSGHEVLSARRVSLRPSGELYEVDGFRRGMVRAMRLRFKKRGTDSVQELIYFDRNLKDNALVSTPEFEAYIRGLGPTNTFVKAASYLMATKSFSRVRALVLEVSQTLFQDDTGVPLRELKTSDWKVSLFGEYTWPISGFGRYTHQPELMARYQASDPSTLQRLPFKMGYHHFGERKQNHMFVRRLPR